VINWLGGPGVFDELAGRIGKGSAAP